MPAQFTGSFETYTNRLCWLQNTYYVDQNTEIPDELEERHKSMLKCNILEKIIIFRTLFIK